MNIEIVDLPLGARVNGGKHAQVREALLALEQGKSLRLPKDTFSGRSPQSLVRLDREGFRVKSRMLDDGLYLWLEPISKSKEAK